MIGRFRLTWPEPHYRSLEHKLVAMHIVPPHIRAAQERRERLKMLLQQQAPDAAAVSRELHGKARGCAFDTNVMIDATLFYQAEDIVRRGIDVPEVHLILMRCYRDGTVVEKNISASDYHLSEAARKGDQAARYLVASTYLKSSTTETRYQALETLIELALNGDGVLKEKALWTALPTVLSSLGSDNLSFEDDQFIGYYAAAFPGGDPALSVIITEATAGIQAANARAGSYEDQDAKLAQAEATKAEVKEWRQHSRDFLARHQYRINALARPIPTTDAPAATRFERRLPAVNSGRSQGLKIAPRPVSCAVKADKPASLNIPFRVLAASGCLLLGFFFFPMFIVAGVIAWSLYSDIKDAPSERAIAVQLEAYQRHPVSIEDIRDMCESPAETAFLDAMVTAYQLGTGPGSVTGGSLRLRSQVGMGRLNIHSSYLSHQYRADFLIDDDLVVEIDGAAYHSSPMAVERDEKRDADMMRDGYSVLRIPAKVVFTDPVEAMRRVEDARVRLRSHRASAAAA